MTVGRSANYIHRRGRTYTCARDSHGRFTRFTRVAIVRRIVEAPMGLGGKHISIYGTAKTREEVYKPRVDAHGNGRDLYDLIRMLKEGYVPRREYRHIHGRADKMLDNFPKYFKRGEWTDCEVKS